MANRFDYVKYDDQAQANQDAFKSMHTEMAAHLEAMKPGRAQSLALTKLEECYMWIGKAIRDDQIARTGSAPLSAKDRE